MWWGHGFPFFIFPGMFFMLFVVAMIVRGFMWRRYARMGYYGCGGRFGGPMDDRFEAETLLRKRLVNGEISEEDYLRLKEILKK